MVKVRLQQFISAMLVGWVGKTGIGASRTLGLVPRVTKRGINFHQQRRIGKKFLRETMDRGAFLDLTTDGWPEFFRNGNGLRGTLEVITRSSIKQS